ncbi:MAG TPA: ABC transporter C-terminal domain-containing protein, partial [Ktedonobacteraceae bacterium]|nr:ABC transporter C-terminal domain-containing protein [Ktedonobacteraceae bacterium]
PQNTQTPQKAAPKKATSATNTASKSSGKKNGKQKVRTVEDVERDIEKAEALVKEVEDALAQAALEADAARLTELSAEYETAKQQVEALLVEWETLADAAS